MSSSLDKQLLEYQSRPKDESGAVKTKQSLIFDPKKASFIDSDTFYQIGYQGFTELMKRDERIAKFEDSIFAYANSQIDPLFLTAEENQKIFDKVEELLYLISDYILFPETVQILEYLIQQFAINRLRPGHLILIMIPYMETSFFVRVLQTIPFKSLPHEFKMLRPFSLVASSKKTISRKILKDWIESRTILMQWLLSSANKILELHPKGVFASFIGVLFTELAVDSSNEIILRAIVDSCKSSLNSNSPFLALQTLMAVATINEKKEMNQNILKSFANLIYKNSKLLEESYNSYLLSAIYFTVHSGAIPSVDFIIALSNDIQKLDTVTKQINVDKFAESCIKTIVSNYSNEDLLRSVVAILETDFFDNVSTSLLLQIAQNYVESDFGKKFIENVASHYPNAITTEVVKCLEKNDIKFTPSQISPHNLIKQLSDPENMASLFSNPDLPFDIASKQVVQALMSAEASGVTESIIPIITFFKGRAPTELIEYLAKNIFVTEKTFSIFLNKALNKYGDGIAPFFKDIPSNNSAIIQHLINQELPDFKIFPFAIVNAIKTNDCNDLFEYLPKINMDFSNVIQKMETLEKTKDISYESIESKTALVLSVIKEISAQNELPVSSISLLFDFPSLRCISPIVKNIKNRVDIYKVFEESEPSQKRLRTNILYYINAIISKVDDVIEFLPIIFIAFTYPEHIEQAITILRSLPLKNKDIKNVITTILRQSQYFKSEQNSLRTVFKTISTNAKNRELFDKIWKRIITSKGCLSFWKLTNDLGVSTIIKSFIDSDEMPQIVSEFLSIYPNNEEIKEIGLKSMNSHLLRAVIPYLSIDMLPNILTPVCCFPRFFSGAFTDFFLNQSFDASILCNIFTSKEKIQIISNPPLEPPKIFQSYSGMKNEFAILPISLIMELIPLSKQITNIEVLIPQFLEILKTKRLQNLVFPCLFKCIDKSADILLENFSIIINSIADSQNPHINSSALKLVQILTNKSPKIVANHSQALFTSLSSSTLFSDDNANLIKIKQLLSSILPILSKSNEVNELIDFFSENINNFSIDRASQLMLHSIQVLGNDSYKIFQSLLKFGQTDFAHLLIEQLEPQQLMTALIRLLETGTDCVKFIFDIQLPPLPNQLLSLFELLSKKVDISEFVQSTCDSFGINDFINLMKSLIHSELDIYPIFHKRIESDQSPLFVNLLAPLKVEIKEFKSLESNLLMLSEITNCMEQKDTSKLIEIIKIMLDGVETDSYTLPNKVQALCFFATSIERFNIVLYEVFPRVIDFASNLYSFIVHESIEALLSSTTASVCLLLKTSPSFCIEKLPQIWTDFLSPIVMNNLSEMVETSFMIITKVTAIDALIRPFLIAYKKNTNNPNSLIVLFKALQNCIANSDKEYFEDNHRRICKFFLLAFSNKYQDWNTMIQIQDEIIYAFCTFLTQLNESLMSINLHQFMNLFEQIMEEGQSDYMINRLFYVRTLNAIFKGLGKTISKYYSYILPTILSFLNTNDDSIFNERQLTIESLELIQTMTQFADDGFFDAEQFNGVLKAIISHANSVVITDPQEFFNLVILHIAPTFAALMDTTKDDMLWRSANLMLIDMMRNDETKIKIAALKICDEEFKVVGSELTTILAELVPSLSECAEYSKDAVDTIARETIQSIENSIGEPIETYFS